MVDPDDVARPRRVRDGLGRCGSARPPNAVEAEVCDSRSAVCRELSVSDGISFEAN